VEANGGRGEADIGAVLDTVRANFAAELARIIHEAQRSGRRAGFPAAIATTAAPGMPKAHE
jgi:hypothetical protein